MYADDASHMEENLALEVLKHWSEVKPAGCALVPEHVETRSLYSPEKPGVEQVLQSYYKKTIIRQIIISSILV